MDDALALEAKLLETSLEDTMLEALEIVSVLDC